MVQATHPAGPDELMGQGHRGDPPVDVPDEGLARGPAGRVPHRPGIVEGPRQGLLAGHVLARLERGDGLLGMEVVGGGHVDEIDIGVATAVRHLVVASAQPQRSANAWVASASRPATIRRPGSVGSSKKPTGGPPGVGVGPAHELGAEQRDVQPDGGARQPTGSATVRIWLTSTSSTTVDPPSGHRTRTSATRVARPSPKWARGSSEDR